MENQNAGFDPAAIAAGVMRSYITDPILLRFFHVISAIHFVPDFVKMKRM